VRIAFRAAFVTLVLGFLVFGREYLFGGEVRTRPAAQRVTLLTPERSLSKPPEPERPKPVEVIEAPVEEIVETVSEAPEESPPINDRLGVDADGGPGSDAFGLAAKRGGRDITLLGETSAGGGGRLDPRIAFAGYAAGLERALQEQLQRLPEVRAEEFSVVVRLWIARDGKVSRWEFARAGDRVRVESLLSRAFGSMPNLREPPPEAMPQPVVLRLMSRRPG
jgi:protein TonB